VVVVVNLMVKVGDGKHYFDVVRLDHTNATFVIFAHPLTIISVEILPVAIGKLIVMYAIDHPSNDKDTIRNTALFAPVLSPRKYRGADHGFPVRVIF
jgi:hypothetical protein